MEDRELPGVLRLTAPRASLVPLVFDSPHSGTQWPEDFAPAADEVAVRRTQDSLVDELFGAAPEHGAPLLAALFPRVYIDPNRSLGDLDPALLADRWDGPLAPGEKSELGKGLIWRLAAPDTPIYDRKLTAGEVRRRIDSFYEPYHTALAALLDGIAERFGGVWHIDCHSMRPMSTSVDKEGPGVARPDIVLSDRDGTSAGASFMEQAVSFLRGEGLEVAINEPFKGAELVARYGDPARNRHSIQIEVNRRLYLDEGGIAAGDGFAHTQALLGRFVGAMAEHVREAARA
ncbi:N-formylglutamate amidohydrolase [Geminicoccaceae bacterium 1502E]|nr:N-formylglutamate amidohydrolase [Geminicoccaceae bacterium 1502E]